MCTVVKSHIQPMGAVKTIQALLSFVVRLYAGLSGIIFLKNNASTHPFALKASQHQIHHTWFVKNEVHHRTRNKQPLYKPVQA